MLSELDFSVSPRLRDVLDAGKEKRSSAIGLMLGGVVWESEDVGASFWCEFAMDSH